MSELESYTNAVAQRDPIQKSGGVNWAILSPLVRDDVPRLLEMLRVYEEANGKQLALARKSDDDAPLTGDTACEFLRLAEAAQMRVEELAKGGSKSKFGAEK